MSINFYEINTKRKIKNRNKIKKWIVNIINRNNQYCNQINIILVNDPYLLEINKTYLNRDYLTDIICFNYNSSNFISGDLYISIERVIENSKIFGVSTSLELLRVIIHGVFHLIGFDDKTDEQKSEIRNAEDVALNELKNLVII